MKKNKEGITKSVWTVLYNPQEGFLKSHLLYLLALITVFVSVQNHVFKEEIDLNGDNATYYIGATAIHQGDGYTNIMTPTKPKTNRFPPGYPFLMSLVMKVSDTFVAQKVFNSILLGLSCLLLYFIVFEFSRNKLTSLTISLLPTLNYLILHFSTMMMSETSFIAFSMLSFFALFKLRENDDFISILKDPYFYILVITSTYAYHIRTQGISLIVAFIVFFLIKKKWKHSLSYLCGFIICALPWMIRNKLAGIGSSRYLHQVLAVNHWRPEEGSMTFGGLIKRMFSTSEMLITKAIPDSIIPNYTVNYAGSSTVFTWIIGILIISLIIFGFWKYFKENMWIFISYIVFSCGVITLWSAPSGNRYLVSIIPLLQMGLLLGIISIIKQILTSQLHKEMKINYVLIPLIFISSFYFLKDIRKISEENNRKIHPAYKNFFLIGKALKKEYPKGDIVVSSRKPSLLYLYSGSYGTRFSYSLNDTIVINNLLNSNVDYVILDQLGYSSTSRYLLPAIQKNQKLFKTVKHLKNPDTYLLWFDKEKAKYR